MNFRRLIRPALGLLGAGLLAVILHAQTVTTFTCPAGTASVATTTTGLTGTMTCTSPTTPPTLVITCPGNQNVSDPTSSPLAVTYPTAATSGGVAPISIVGSPASGSNFSVGSTAVTQTATSTDGQIKSCQFTVNVAFTAVSACGMQLASPAVFCDPFTSASGNGNRSGDLNGVVWGTSRAIGQVNLGQQSYNDWAPVHLVKCDGTSPSVIPPHDIIICDGQMREASNDNVSGVFDAGDVTVLAMYPKQPFDFGGRTGTVSFDVSNDSHSIHAAWPEFWITDTPNPAPFTHLTSWNASPQNGVGVRFAAEAQPGDIGECQNSNNLDKMRWTVDSAVAIRNYVFEDTFTGVGSTGMTVTQLDCVTSPPAITSGTAPVNHVELQISQNRIDVYASDSGQTTLRHIAAITGANLSFTRGLIWLEDVHYNADKGDAPSQREHTFAWDNVAFDGPFTYKDLNFDAPDALTSGPNGSVNLGKVSNPNQQTSWSVAGLPATRNAAAARVVFNAYSYTAGIAYRVTVNGHAHTITWPFPDQQTFTWRTFAYTIPLTDLITGTNTVQIGATDAIVSSNVGLVLVNVP